MTDTAPAAAPADTALPRHRNPLGNLLRGALIGVVETVPGVSGGTVALVTGIYDELIEAGHRITAAARRLVTGPERVAGAREQLRGVNWLLVLPLLVGMAAAVLTVAGPVARLVEDHPETMRTLFLGLVAGSVLVPVRLSGGAWRGAEFGLFAIGAVGGLLLTSLPSTSLEPSPWVVAPAAAIAVCALVLPGVSGSFLLLSVGLYQPTLQAVDQRDLGYIAWFGLWALVGLVVIVKLMRILLTRHHPRHHGGARRCHDRRPAQPLAVAGCLGRPAGPGRGLAADAAARPRRRGGCAAARPRRVPPRRPRVVGPRAPAGTAPAARRLRRTLAA